MTRRQRSTDPETAAAVAALAANTPYRAAVPDEAYLSTGLTLYNLALSNKADGGIPKGSYLWMVGDSESGKTFLSMMKFAEAARNKHFADHRIIHDNAERGALMDVGRFFGRSTAKRIEPPRGTRKNPRYSYYVEDFYDNLDRTIGAGPCIYLLDSMDVLVAMADEKKIGIQRNARARQMEARGSMGGAKAKENSGNIKRFISKLDVTGSILIIISQIRDNVKMGPFAFGPDRKPSGGYALRSYAHAQVWTTDRGPLYRTVNGKPRKIGSAIEIEIYKNRLSGAHTRVTVPFHRTLGFDETGANVDFLVEERYWKTAASEKEKEGTVKPGRFGKKRDPDRAISAPEFGYNGKREGLVRMIEAEDGEEELRSLVVKVWTNIEEGCRVERKARYR